MTLVCVPINVDDIDQALSEAAEAEAKSADLVEFRVDPYFPGSEGDAEDAYRIRQLQRLIAESPLPVILTCRSADEGGDYDGDDADRVSLFEKLTAASDHPPAYLDVELATYTRSANLRQKINLCVAHPAQARDITTRLILSVHDFDGVPADLNRRLLRAYEEPACAVVKVAVRARTLRDNLALFDLLDAAPKPTIALGMGEFGLMSRVLAPKFNGYLTFASLRETAATAPGQPTIDDLVTLYRFRTINRHTRLYGVAGWPVAHSLGPLIHNAGFASIGWNGVYLPLPISVDDGDPADVLLVFRATLEALLDRPNLDVGGVSVTIPFKTALATFASQRTGRSPDHAHGLDALNTVVSATTGTLRFANTDAAAIEALLATHRPAGDRLDIHIVGTGGVARAAAHAARDHRIIIHSRNEDRARSLAASLPLAEPAGPVDPSEPASGVFINCTPVGMAGGPAPDALSIPVPDMRHVEPGTVFFDTVYNPVETPMLLAARRRGFPTIDGVAMFARQAADQFERWTGAPGPVDLFDRLCRTRLAHEP